MTKRSTGKLPDDRRPHENQKEFSFPMNPVLMVLDPRTLPLVPRAGPVFSSSIENPVSSIQNRESSIEYRSLFAPRASPLVPRTSFLAPLAMHYENQRPQSCPILQIHIEYYKIL
jgi:hypothetical protein